MFPASASPRASYPLICRHPTGPGVRARRGRRTRWRDAAAQHPTSGRRHAPSHRARRPRTRLHQPQPGRRLRRPRRRRAPSSARAATSAPAARTPRSTPCARPATAPAAAPPTSPSNPATTPAAPAPAPRRSIEAGIARVVYAVADPNPQATGGARHPARGRGRRRGRAARRRGRGGQRRLADLRTPAAARTSSGSTPPPSTAGSPPPTAPAAGSPPPESRADVHRLRAEADAVVVGSGTVRADDPHLAVRGVDGAVAAAAGRRRHRAPRAVRPGARVLDDAAPTLVAVAEDADAGRPPRRRRAVRLPRAPGGRPALDLDALLARPARARASAPSCSKAAPPWPAPSSRPAPSTRSSATSPPSCSAPAPPPSPTPESPPSPQALRLDVTETVRIGPDLRITAVPAARSATEEH